MKVYFAGKVSKSDWRTQIVGQSIRDVDGSKPWPNTAIGESFDYSGPYFTSCDHGCGHGGSHALGAPDGVCLEGLSAQPHGGAGGDHRSLNVGLRDHVFKECQAAIERSDFVFAWIDDLTAFGTIWEIGLAIAKGVTVYVSGPLANEPQLWLVTHGCRWIQKFDGPLDAFENAMGWARASTPIQWIDLTAEEQKQKALEFLRSESPIEERLAVALAASSSCVVTYDGETDQVTSITLDRFWFLTGQEQVGPYRLDMALARGSFRLAIECDGHDFHEKTKDQASRDKARDRYLTQNGWRILRFTGSEIHRNPAACATQVLDTAKALCALENSPALNPIGAHP